MSAETQCKCPVCQDTRKVEVQAGSAFYFAACPHCSYEASAPSLPLSSTSQDVFAQPYVPPKR